MTEPRRARVDDLPDGPRIVTVCGSARFTEKLQLIALMLSLEGDVVLTYGHYGDVRLTEREEQVLGDLLLQKVWLSDALYVVNKGGEVDEITQRAITRALELDLEIEFYQEPEPRHRMKGNDDNGIDDQRTRGIFYDGRGATSGEDDTSA